MVIHENSENTKVALTWSGVRRGAVRLSPVSIFVIPFGIAFGAAAVEQGVSATQAVIMSALVFAGASQFAVLELWSNPLPYLSIALVTLAVNARNIILGATISPWINQLPLKDRVIALTLLSDPNFAESNTAYRDGERDAGFLVGGGLILWVTWVFGTGAGVFAGSWIGSLEQLGVDVVMIAFFAAVVVGEVKSPTSVIPVLVAVFVAVVTYGHVPTGWNVIIAALCGGFVGVLAGGRTKDAR